MVLGPVVVVVVVVGVSVVVVVVDVVVVEVVVVDVVVHGDGMLSGHVGYPTRHPAPISIHTFAYVGVT